MGLPGPSWNWLTEPISNHALLCHVMVVLPAWLLSCMLVRVMHPVVTTWRPSFKHAVLVDCRRAGNRAAAGRLRKRRVQATKELEVGTAGV